MLTVLGKNNSILSQFLAELRDREVQQDKMRFRRNMERIGEIFAYEISKKLAYTTTEVSTQLGVANVRLLKEQPVVGSILRAGLPFHQGILNVFDKADNAFISAYRKHHRDGTFDISMESIYCPPLNDRILILADPMLATGASVVRTYKALMEYGKPAQIHIAAVLASAEGLSHVQRNLSSDVQLWVADIDDELTAQAYIVPGLGDAGDLAFGKKH